MGCYTIIYREDELILPYSEYSNLTYDFIKVSDWNTTYNCLAYALGFTDRWMNPPGSLEETTDFMESRGYHQISSATDNCIVAYGTEADIVHFAKIQNGVVTAKLGDLEVMQHSSADAYYSQSDYGSVVAYYAK